jgi:hypothetical protein
MMLLTVLAAIFLLVAVTRPGPSRLRFGRYRRRHLPAPIKPSAHAPDPTLGLRDPSRPL